GSKQRHLLRMDHLMQNSSFDRVTLIVLDSVGMGEMPDAAAWGDAGADTLGHICGSREVVLPNFQQLGLGNVRVLAGVPPVERPHGSFGRCALRSNGKDTTTGHWEMAGIILDKAFPTYPEGFPEEIIERFIKEARVPGVLGNVPASGTEIIKELGAEHVRSEEHTSELQSQSNLVCRLLLEKKKNSKKEI